MLLWVELFGEREKITSQLNKSPVSITGAYVMSETQGYDSQVYTVQTVIYISRQYSKAQLSPLVTI